MTITPQADTAVMVVYPRHPHSHDHSYVQRRHYRAFFHTLNVRNPGSATLSWNVDPIPALPTDLVPLHAGSEVDRVPTVWRMSPGRPRRTRSSS